MTDIVRELSWAGYLPGGVLLSGVFDDGAVHKAISTYAERYRLPHTEEAVREHLSRRYCRNPDRLEPAKELCRWPHSPVRVYVNFSIGSFSAGDVREAFAWSLDRWGSVSGFRWEFVDRPEDANILPDKGRIDGNANTLAWSYLPCGFGADGVAKQLYDSSDSVLVRSYEFLRAVILHELGHALGLEHSTDERAIMYPAARDNVLDLGGDDIPRIKELYPGEGKPPEEPAPDPEPPSGEEGEVIGSFVGRYQGEPGRFTLTFKRL